MSKGNRTLHLNLHQHASMDKIYEDLQDAHNKTVNFVFLWRIVFAITAVGGIFLSGHPEWFWLFAGMYALRWHVCAYVDNSNRNWFMHMIDWNCAERAHAQRD